MFVLDIVAESMVGQAPQAIVRPGAARRLNLKHPESLKNYNRVLEELLEKHRLTEKQREVHNHKDGLPDLFKSKMDRIDQQSKELLWSVLRRNAERSDVAGSPSHLKPHFYRTLLLVTSRGKEDE